MKLTNKPHITFVGINFYPEDTAIGLYTTQLAEHLQQQGFDISVITGFPYYPAWKISQEYHHKPRNYQEKYRNINIYRYRQYVPENPNFLKRIFHLLDFTIGSYFNLKNIKKTNLVIAIVPFTTDVWLASKLAKKHHAKLWVHIQDFEFDAAYEAKLTSKTAILFKYLHKIEERLFQKANILSTISFAMLAKLKKKVTADKITYLLPNWVDSNIIDPNKAKRHPYLTSKKFKILYAGNIGQKQDWLLFKKIVEHCDPNEIEFVIVGDGAAKKEVLDTLKHLPQVHFYPPVSFKDLNHLLCSADMHILCQKQDVIDTVMPSKILGMMASEKPSLIAGNKKSEVAKIIEESEGGFYFSNEDFDEITATIKYLKKHPTVRKIYGKNAREYVKNHFDSQKLLNDFTQKIRTLLDS